MAPGLYSLYCDVNDGEVTAIDPFTANNNELEVVDQPDNIAPVIATSATSVTPPSLDQLGAEATDQETLDQINKELTSMIPGGP